MNSRADKRPTAGPADQMKAVFFGWSGDIPREQNGSSIHFPVGARCRIQKDRGVGL